MGILINTGFDVGSSNPVDSRTVKNTIDDRDALITDGYVYEGMEVYCKDTKVKYRWNGAAWEEVGTGGSGGITDVSMTDYYTKTEVNNDFLKKTDAASTYATKTDIETISSIILDSEVRLDKTYSSSKIYSSIQDAIDTSKAYTLSELGKMSGASYKVVTATNEMTDEKIIYLLDNGTTFDMYIVDNGTPTKIGDTDIDLSDYYTKTEVDNDFLKKTDATSIYATKTELNEKVNDFGDINNNYVGKETVLYEGCISTIGTHTLADNVNDYDFIIINYTETEEGMFVQSLTMSKSEISKCISNTTKFMCNYGYSNSTSYVAGYFDNDKLIISNLHGQYIRSITGYKFGQITVANTITNPSLGASYSTDEQLTGGTWIDGKPIYRKVFDYSNNLWSSGNKDISSLKIKQIISSRFIGCDKSNGGGNQWAQGTTGYDERILYFDNVYSIMQRDGKYYYKYIILEYTKATDY